MVFRFGRFEFNDARYELARDGEPVSAEPRVLEVLAYLLAHRDRVVSKDELLDELWDEVAVSESALTRTIKKARDILDEPSWIKAVYGRGYTIDCEVEAWEMELLPAMPPVEPASSRSRWRTLTLATAAVALVVATFALLRVPPDRRETSVPSTVVVRSLAVLPLVDLSPSPGDDFFAAGLTEALITRLANLGGLRIISRTSVMRYRETTRSLAEIARELDVDAVLEGSVVRTERRVRIDVQLRRTADAEILWAQDFERELGDVLQLQAEIARAVANAVELRLTAGESSRLMRAGSVDAEAYRLYLLGRFHIHRRTIEDFRESIEHLTHAIRLDADYARAHSALADAFILLSTYYGLQPEEAFPKARRAAESALALDPYLSEAHASLGVVSLALEWDFLAAEESYQHAIQLAPGNATAHQWYGELLSILGRHDEAIAEGRRAWQLDPLSPIINAALGQRLNAAGRWREALDQFGATLELDPRFAWIHRERAYAFSQLGNREQALDEREREMQVRGIDEAHLGDLRQRIADEGMTGFWRWELERLRRTARSAYVPALLYAEAWQGLGDRDQALSFLGKALEERGDHVLQLTTSPQLRALAADPAARLQLVEVGLGHLTVPDETPTR